MRRILRMNHCRRISVSLNAVQEPIQECVIVVLQPKISLKQNGFRQDEQIDFDLLFHLPTNK